MPLSRADLLAVQRTVLANERTFLAYFRTGAALLTSGVAIQSIDFFASMRGFAQLLLWCAPLVLLVGVSRFFVVRRQIRAIAQPTSSESLP
jgi:putative membrane protein